MKSALKLFAAISIFFLAPTSAFALLEARVSYGFLASNTDLSSLCPTCTASAPSIVPTYGLGIDAIVTLPMPLVPGFGLRYENMGLKVGSGGLDFESQFTRTALVLNWRPLDSLIYAGPIFTYGLSHSTELKAIESGTTKANFSSDSVTSYSLGIEGGVKLIGISVGAEVGYMNFKWNDAHDKTGNAQNQDINMSGPYTKFILGFSI